MLDTCLPYIQHIMLAWDFVLSSYVKLGDQCSTQAEYKRKPLRWLMTIKILPYLSTQQPHFRKTYQPQLGLSVLHTTQLPLWKKSTKSRCIGYPREHLPVMDIKNKLWNFWFTHKKQLSQKFLRTRNLKHISERGKLHTSTIMNILAQKSKFGKKCISKVGWNPWITNRLDNQIYTLEVWE